MTSCTATVATDNIQMWRIWNPGRVDNHMAGMPNVAMRVALLITDGTVLPRAWNIDEQVKITPVATKFHEMM